MNEYESITVYFHTEQGDGSFNMIKKEGLNLDEMIEVALDTVRKVGNYEIVELVDYKPMTVQ